MMKLLTHLILGGCLSLVFLIPSHATSPKPINLDKGEITSSMPKSSLTLEESQYVLEECESFANEDDISSDHLSAYIKTCIEELSAAVKLALDNLQKQSDSVASNTK